MEREIDAASGARAVFLDRDGTIVEDVGYASSLDQLEIYPETIGALHELKEAGFRLIVVSNQSGVARGLIDPSFPDEALRRLRETLTWNGAPLLDGGYHCPHHPEAELEQFRQDCECRKPEPGMLLEAARDFSVDLSRSYVVGDHFSDVETAHRVGASGVLVLTGHGMHHVTKLDQVEPIARPDFVATDILEAARWIILHQRHQ